MQHDYYKAYYDLERQHWWFLAREKIISNYIKKLISDGNLSQNPLRILNIGCGPGRSSQYLSVFGEVTSVEYDRDCCLFASEKTRLKIINGSITELPFLDNSFDLVCAFDVIEHVQDDEKAVLEMKRVAVSNGILLITVPAFMSMWSHHDVVNHHFRRYKINHIKNLFENIKDGRMIFTSYFNFLLFTPIWMVRQLSNLIKSGKNRPGSGSDFETFKPGLLNNILYKIMVFESKLINRNFKLPFGVSIIYSWKKL